MSEAIHPDTLSETPESESCGSPEAHDAHWWGDGKSRFCYGADS